LSFSDGWLVRGHLMTGLPTLNLDKVAKTLYHKNIN